MKISEGQLSTICDGIRANRDSIIRHNPMGPDDEVLLWMLLNSLVLYLSLDEMETPCFTGKADAATYRNAISYILEDRRSEDFDIDLYLDKLLENDS